MTIIKSNAHTPIFPTLFDNFFGKDVQRFMEPDFTNTVPAVNIAETAEHFRVDVAVPGLQKEDFKVNIHNGQLTISSQKERSHEEKHEKFTRKEFAYSSFQRSFMLPDTVNQDAVEAKYNDGILSVFIPKKEEAKVRPVREINIA